MPPPPPIALTIAGSDCSGGAGIQADLKTFTVFGVYGASVVTALTAQNTTGVQHAWILDPRLLEFQIESVAGDLSVRATKTGMLGTRENIAALARAVKKHHLFPLVVDPVMVAKSGHSLIDDAAVETLGQTLLPLATLVTPNRHEAARLLGLDYALDDLAKAAGAAQRICRDFGAAACIIKGIRRETEAATEMVDVYCDGKDIHELAAPWHVTNHTHGSGCTFSAAIAAALARGEPLAQAVRTAKSFISAAIAGAAPLGHGTSPVNPLVGWASPTSS